MTAILYTIHLETESANNRRNVCMYVYIYFIEVAVSSESFDFSRIFSV